MERHCLSAMYPLHHGKPIQKYLLKYRVTENELLSGIRSAGLKNVEDAYAEILETDGRFSVLPATGSKSATSLEYVVTPDTPS